MITQHYKIPATTEHIDHARPGCFVFTDDDSEVVSGFIDFVSDCEMAIMLFEPEDVNVPGMVNISETCDWSIRLREIVTQDYEMANQWYAILNN
jgi:hypothetical protein